MFALPEALARDGLALRPAAAADRPFLRALFATARLDAPLLAQWPEPQREAFLDSQFHFQDVHYRRFFESADFLIVARHAVPVGRLILDRGASEWRIVDISFLPQTRGQGIGTALLEALIAAAADAGAARVSLHVEIGNRAQALYRRLGFAASADAGDDEVGTHLAMVRQLKTAS
ncbi:MAG TPA: GNAT family N-acetyltransferase [Rhizomicrobium sp.]|jgi:ribosomal protein S18 acetylase RimI-like enzyme|nr:GNAT family N-acetyltransferase [Rhizomicrobium sp.]